MSGIARNYARLGTGQNPGNTDMLANIVLHRPTTGGQVFNTGSFMPQGYLKQYAGLSLTGWTYGAHELTLRDGQIESVRTWSELELRERYA